jgi:hypothetical protein
MGSRLALRRDQMQLWRPLLNRVRHRRMRRRVRRMQGSRVRISGVGEEAGRGFILMGGEESGPLMVTCFTGRGVRVVNMRFRGLQMELQRLDAVPGPCHLCQQVRCSKASCALRKKQTGFFLSLARHYAPHQEVCFSPDSLGRKRGSSEPAFLASLARRCIIIGFELMKLIRSPFPP